MTSVSSYDPKPWIPSYPAPQPDTAATPAVKVAPAASESPSSPARLNLLSGEPEAATYDAAPLTFSWRADDRESHATQRNADLPDSPGARAAGDAQVARAYAKAVVAGTLHVSSAGVQVSPQSTLGRWRTQLDNAFKGPGFLAWAREQGLDVTRLTLNPSRGELTGFVKGKTQTFSLEDDSGWPDVSRALLTAAKALTSEPGQTLSVPWGGAKGEMPLEVVAKFYGEPLGLTLGQATARSKALLENPRFSAPAGNTSTRSETVLAAQQELLGDDANNHALIIALKSQVDDVHGNIDLSKVMVSVDLRSESFRKDPQKRREMSAAEQLGNDGLHVPRNAREALNLAEVKSFDLVHRAPRADAGGVQPLTVLPAFTPGTRRAVQRYSTRWMAEQSAIDQKPALAPGAGVLLRRLLRNLPEDSRRFMGESPSADLDTLIRSSSAQELGHRIERGFRTPKTSTSTIEWVSAALVADLDPGLGRSRHNLAGYNLYSSDNVGASTASIIKRFTTHLEGKVGIEVAPVAARLLLSVAAPEFLVKNMSTNLVYGSHTWANLAIEVARIEQQVPGAAANMTFGQVMAFGDTSPVSKSDVYQLNKARAKPHIDWGIANGVIKATADHIYIDQDIELSRKALLKQQGELSWASKALKAPPPTRQALALEELKRVFPEVNPERKVLKANTGLYGTSSLFSLLDAYMSGDIEPKKWNWVSKDNEAVPYESMKSRFSELVPDIKKKFDEAFAEYKKSHESAMAIQFKYQLSLLPVVDRENIRNSDVGFYELHRPYDRGVVVKSNGHENYQQGPEPGAEEVEKLKGRYGLLMRSDRGNGRVDYYSYFPGSARMVKESGMPETLVHNPQKPWRANFGLMSKNDKGSRLNIDDGPYYGEAPQNSRSQSIVLVAKVGRVNTDRDPPESSDKISGPYFSGRNGALGLTASSHFIYRYDVLKQQAEGSTEIEQSRKTDEEIRVFFRSLIPFYDGVQSAIKGDVGGAAFEIGFDALGFVLPFFGAARKAYKGGRSTFNIIKSGVFAGAGASLGISDAADLPKNSKKVIQAITEDANYLMGKADEALLIFGGGQEVFNVAKKYKENDVVKGFYRTHIEGEVHPSLAIFSRGSWYAYNVLTKTPFGPQIVLYGTAEAVTS